MTCPGFTSNEYDLYALGSLSEENTPEIREHLRSECETCQENLRHSLEITARMGLAVQIVQPPRHLREKILAAIRPARSGLAALLASPWLAWTGFGVATVAGGALAWMLYSRAAAPPAPAIVAHVGAPSAPAIILPAAPNLPAIPTGQAPIVRAPAENRAEALARELASAKSTADLVARELTAQQARAAQLEKDVQSKSADLASAQRELERTRAQYQAATRDLARSADAEKQLAALRDRVDSLTRQVHFYQTAIESQRRDLSQNLELVSLLSAPALKLIDLSPTKDGQGSAARALVAGNNRILFYASHLPALASGRTYQLWLIKSQGNAVQSGGLFQPDRSQSAVVEVRDPRLIAGLTALAVTEEPAGGVPAPTGPKILFGLKRS